MTQRPLTYPAPKYGPTAFYGDCEVGTCGVHARSTCAACRGHFCLGHVEHAAHTVEAKKTS